MADKKQDNRRPKGDTGIAEIYTSSMGNPPMDDDMGSMQKYLKEKKPPPPILAAPNKPEAKPAAKVDKKAGGGSVQSASSRGDGCAIRGKTRGKMV